MRYIYVLILLLAGPAHAYDICDDLWLSRNMIFAQNGFCFGSPLGQSVFSDFNCTGTDISLTILEKDLVAQVREREAEDGCTIDTSRTKLDFEENEFQLRLQLEQQPIRSVFESSCIGYKFFDEPPIRTAPNENASQIGSIGPADTIYFEYFNFKEWSFVTVFKARGPMNLGWVKDFDFGNACLVAAG